jgi:hypothetical protein
MNDRLTERLKRENDEFILSFLKNESGDIKISYRWFLKNYQNVDFFEIESNNQTLRTSYCKRESSDDKIEYNSRHEIQNLKRFLKKYDSNHELKFNLQ